ncbi:MAG: transposase [Candidatus Kerfeldbacteria bacterium]
MPRCNEMAATLTTTIFAFTLTSSVARHGTFAMTQRAIDGQHIYFVTTNTAFGLLHFTASKTAVRFSRVLRRSCIQYDFALFGFCVLPNHVHLLVRRNGRYSLSKLMNIVKGRYSILLRQGRFWQPRFNFRIIDSDLRFNRTVEYIRYNFRKTELPERYGKPPWVYIDEAAREKVGS